MNVLGLSAFAGESAAALISEGRLAAWAEEATFSDGAAGVPWRAAEWCLRTGEVSAAHLDAVALAHKPLQAFDHLVSSALADAPAGWPRFSLHAERRLGDFGLGPRLRARLGFRGPLLYVERLQALAQAAWETSGFPRAAVLLAGADAEWADCALAVAEERSPRLLAQLDHPHGLSALWRAFCAHRGASPRKVAALAASGRPTSAAAAARELLDLRRDGSFRLDRAGLSGAKLLGVLGHGDAADAAASLQALTEEVLLRMAAEARLRAGCEDLCVAGALAANDSAMARLRAAGPGRLACSAGPLDAALGGALAAWRGALQREAVDLSRPACPPAPVRGAEDEDRSWTRAAAAAAAKAGCGAAYFLALTPYSLPLRLLGVEFLEERFRATGTYWKDRALEAEGVRAYRRAF